MGKELKKLHKLLGELYQVLGALDAPANVLDNVSAAVNSQPLPHDTLLPLLPTDGRIEQLEDELERAHTSFAHAAHASITCPQPKDEPRLLSHAEDMSTCTLGLGGTGYFYNRVDYDENDEPVNFDLDRMKKSVEGPFYTVPTGLNREQLREWMSNPRKVIEQPRKEKHKKHCNMLDPEEPGAFCNCKQSQRQQGETVVSGLAHQVIKARTAMAKWPPELLSGLRLEGTSEYGKAEQPATHSEDGRAEFEAAMRAEGYKRFDRSKSGNYWQSDVDDLWRGFQLCWSKFAVKDGKS